MKDSMGPSLLMGVFVNFESSASGSNSITCGTGGQMAAKCSKNFYFGWQNDMIQTREN